MAHKGKEGMMESREQFGWQQNKDGLVNLDPKEPGNELEKKKISGRKKMKQTVHT